MKFTKVVGGITEHYPYIGPVLWILNIQYFIITLIVARAWTVPYSFFNNTISDLGNSSCGIFTSRFVSGAYVCSPEHTLMNISFMLTGIYIALGALFIYPKFKKNRGTLIGFSCVALGGLGGILVGFFPENTIGYLHVTGAALNFLIGNIGLVILGYSLQIPRWLRVYTIAMGILTLIFLVFFTLKIYLGIGIGGTERLVSYPQTTWLITFGIYMISKSDKKTDS